MWWNVINVDNVANECGECHECGEMGHLHISLIITPTFPHLSH